MERLEQMKTTICDTRMVSTGRKARKTDLGIKKLYGIVQLLLNSEKNKWTEKMGLCLINCAVRSWISETENSTECSSDELQQGGKKLTTRGQNSQGTLYGDVMNHKLD
jgi:hypothetical protein